MAEQRAEFFGIAVKVSDLVRPGLVCFEAYFGDKLYLFHCVEIEEGEEQKAFWAAQREVWRIAPIEREAVEAHYLMNQATFERCGHLFTSKLKEP